jgi:hypothetical protein
MPQIGLERPGIDAVIRELVAAGVAQHVSVRLDAELAGPAARSIMREKHGADSYTIYRVALTMDIMFLVVLSSIFLNFAPLTAVMIVLMSLLDDVPIMTIAYDNTPMSEKPIRWQMPSLLGVSLVLGLFSIAESFGLLLMGSSADCIERGEVAGVVRSRAVLKHSYCDIDHFPRGRHAACPPHKGRLRRLPVPPDPAAVSKEPKLRHQT